MAVLSFTVMTLVIGVLLRGLDDTSVALFGNDGWRFMQVGALLVAHNMAGIVSWEAHYHSFSNRLLWLLAVALHPIIYTVNWHIYADLVLASSANILLQNITALGLVIIPTILVYGGPFNALVNAPPGSRAAD